MQPAGRASEPAERAPKPAGRAPEPVGRPGGGRRKKKEKKASEPAGRPKGGGDPRRGPKKQYLIKVQNAKNRTIIINEHFFVHCLPEMGGSVKHIRP